MLCSMGGVVLVAVFSQQDNVSHHNNSTTNFSDTSTGTIKIHETPLGYVVSHHHMFMVISKAIKHPCVQQIVVIRFSLF